MLTDDIHNGQNGDRRMCMLIFHMVSSYPKCELIYDILSLQQGYDPVERPADNSHCRAFHLILFVLASIDLWRLRKSAKSPQREKYIINELQQIRGPLITHPPPSYSASNRDARSKDVERGKNFSCPDCNLPGLGCCER